MRRNREAHSGDLTRVTEDERKLLDLIRETGYGEMIVSIEDGRISSVEEIKQSILL